MNTEVIIKLLRYLTVFGAIYLLARFNPKIEISNINSILISLVVVLMYVVGEYLVVEKFRQTESCSKGSCQTEQFADKTQSELENRLKEMTQKMQKLESDLETLKGDDKDSLDDYPNYHNLPYTENSDAQYGYSFLPPSQWYPQPPQPPVCVTDKKCPVCPVMSTPGYTDLLLWDDSRNVSKPMGIDTKYIDEKLNLKNPNA